MLYTILAGMYLFGDGLFSLGRRYTELKSYERNRFTLLIRAVRVLIGLAVVLAGEFYLPLLETLGVWLVIESVGSITWYREELSASLSGEPGESISIQVKKGILSEMAFRMLRLCLGLSFVIIA